MAKKKKGKLQDGRGYGQKAAPPPSSSVPASQATHEGMMSLLNQMKDVMEPTAAPNPSIASDRFTSRLQNIIDRLTELGFQDQHLEDVVQDLQYSITLESALDWLCLRLSSLELPPILTDCRLRDSISTITTNQSFTVLKFQKPTTGNSDTHADVGFDLGMPQLINPSPKGSRQENVEETESEQHVMAQQKAWLLQQYQYADDEDDDQDYFENDVDNTHQELMETAMVQLPGNDDTSNNSLSSTTRPAPVTDLEVPPQPSQDEILLLEQEKQLLELEADVNNEANNYMRSKQEIKELRIELKKKRQEVQGIRKRIEKEKFRREKEEKNRNLQENGHQEDENDDEESGFVDLFGGNSSTAEEPQSIAMCSPAISIPPTPKDLINAVIPRDWTGATPQKVLEEQCRRQKLPRPKFTKLRHPQGYTLLVTLLGSKKSKPEEFTAYQSDFASGSSLPDFLATKALYQLQPTLQLYHMFPTDFRDIWLSWLREVDEMKLEKTRLQDLARQQRLNHFLSLVESQPRDDTTTDNLRSSSTVDESPIIKNRGSNETKKGLDAHATSLVGRRLQEEFEQRRESLAYQKMLNIRSALPMTSFRQDVLEMVKKYPVTIISAQTGAGKTTQCPQYLLEQALFEGQGGTTQILVTQPRRVAATSVAERVSEEMCEPRLGRWVGYQIRMDSKRSADTKLLFCTTGIVLRRLQEDRNLEGVTHVVVDEVHERQQQTDVLLIALRELLSTTRPDLKVILMSATMDSSLFCQFFGGAPLLNIPGRTFPVSNYHLEDLLEATGHIVEEGSRYALRNSQTSEEKSTLWVTRRGGEKRRETVDLVSQTDVSDVSDDYPGYAMSTRRSMDRVNEEIINYDLLEDVLDLLLCRPDQNSTLLAPEGADLTGGSILIFLPGMGEIRTMTDRLEGNRRFRDSNRFEIIPLHSALSSREQRRAFLPAKQGCRKIILSTNIAETSVTIPDVVCVIDSGRVREIRRNKRTSTSILVTDWCSKASSKQRAGRAGRVQPGICLKLYSSQTATKVMKSESEPELRRVPLEEICLSILASGLAKSAMDFLSKAPQPPDQSTVEAALKVLEDVGAVTRNPALPKVDQLTPLGQHLAKIPVDARLGKMLIFGALFRCLDKVLTIAASLSSQSPFPTFMANDTVAKAKQRAFLDPDSDFVTFCNVWESYRQAAAESTSSARKFCQANYLSFQALNEIADARRNFLDLLCSIGFVDKNALGRSTACDAAHFQKSIYNENRNNLDVLHAVICAGLYPNIAQLKAAPSTPEGCTLKHKTEVLHFYSTSVNSRKKAYTDSWVAFHEKFGTPSRVSISTTCFIHPYALLLLGGSVVVKHTERVVLVDGWIKMNMAAQIGVILKELRKNIDVVLAKMLENAQASETNSMEAKMVEGIVQILAAA